MSEGSQTYWFVSKPSEVGTDELSGYLAISSWTSPNPQAHRSALATMNPGDPIALKSSGRRNRDLPFFSGDNVVSVNTMHATGRIQTVDVESGVVKVDWTPTPGRREWFFFTNTSPIWAVERGKRPEADQLIAFAFEGSDQDLSRFLKDPYWSPRFAPTPGFSWIPFYEEFATRLLPFRDRGTELLDVVFPVATRIPMLAYLLTDRFADGSQGPLREVDPFTVMATFNRGLTTENRQEVAAALGDALGVTAPLPGDFDGIPLVHNQKSWFITQARLREQTDVPTLWRLFAAGLSFAGDDSTEARTELAAAFDQALTVRGVKWNLTQGLYWARPHTFVTLDGPSRDFLAARLGIKAPTDGAGYVRILDDLTRRFERSSTQLSNFPELSYAAWVAARTREAPHSLAGLAQWALRLAEEVDQDAVENEYKRQAAGLMARTRDAARADDPSWTSSLLEALKATNTIDFRYADNVNKAAETHPQALKDAFETVWSDPQPASLDRLNEALQGTVDKSTAGIVTSLGALLLSAADAERYPPYSTTRARKWLGLTGFEGQTSGSPAERYTSLLGFLDKLRDEVLDRGGVAATPLEVQGLAWTATENDSALAELAPDERKALTVWRAGGSEPPRAWLVRAKPPTVANWLSEGYVSLPAAHLGRVPPGAELKAVAKAVEAGYQHVDYAQRQLLAAEYHAFLSKMRPGDLIVTHGDDWVHAGRISDPPNYESGVEDRLRRGVEWETSTPRGDITAALEAALETKGTVVDLTDSLDPIAEFLDSGGLVLPPPPDEGQPTKPPDMEPGGVALPGITAGLAKYLHMDVEPLQEIVDLLADRKQVVLYGPPGTGKTYLALTLARHLVGDDASRVQLVQFHPSYAYEDFFEGFRPSETAAGHATFKITAGPLRQLAGAAREDPNRPFVLIIDEMNRANLAKVFGELYFLLEYRDRSIQLQYSPTDAFKLPDNLFIIGTMNTADRSIALLDAAMRRRFAFVELHPEEVPVREVLARFVNDQGIRGDRRPALLSALNSAIEDTDRDFKIGPSYLMRPDATTEVGLDRIWRHDILPLLEEHYYGRLTRQQVHERFGLATLTAKLGPVSGEGAAATDTDEQGTVEQIDVAQAGGLSVVSADESAEGADQS